MQRVASPHTSHWSMMPSKINRVQPFTMVNVSGKFDEVSVIHDIIHTWLCPLSAWYHTHRTYWLVFWYCPLYLTQNLQGQQIVKTRCYLWKQCIHEEATIWKFVYNVNKHSQHVNMSKFSCLINIQISNIELFM